jgi:hypothetical protein
VLVVSQFALPPGGAAVGRHVEDDG